MISLTILSLRSILDRARRLVPDDLVRVSADVTAVDLESGVRCSPDLCPLSRAARRLLKDDCTIFVGPETFLIRSGLRAYRAHLTPEAVSFVDGVDGRRPSRPGPVPLEIPRRFVKAPG